MVPEDITMNFRVRAYLKYWPYVIVIFRYAGWSIVGVGVMGNMMALYTLSSKHFKKTPTTFLMKCMAVTDILTLVTYLLPQVLDIYQIFIMSSHTNTCKIFYFAKTVAGTTSSWTLVLITVERCISVLKPLQVQLICTYKRMVVAWIVMTLVISILSVPILVDFKVAFSNILQADFCQYHSESIWVYVQWNETILKIVAPTILIFLGNLVIIIVLVRGAVARRQLQVTKNTENLERSVTIMLTINAVAYLVLTSPKAIYANFILPDDSADIIKSYDDWIIPVIYLIIDHIHQLNHSINFFLYILTGQHFRRAFFKAMLPCCLSNKYKQSQSNSDGSSQTKTISKN